MEEFYITKDDIKIVLSDASPYLINKHFQNCKEYCDKNEIPLFSVFTVPTEEFCNYMKLDYELFVKVLKERKKRDED